MKSYKRTHAADAANLFIRNLLCEISERLGGFTEKDWKNTCKYFDGKCAYTGVPLRGANRVKDHLIGHNRKHGGLHLYGNVVLASKEANASKGEKSLEEFYLSDAACLQGMSKEQRQERMDKIKAFQQESGYFEKYALLKEDLSTFLNQSYDEIIALAEAKKGELSLFLDEPEVELVPKKRKNKKRSRK